MYTVGYVRCIHCGKKKPWETFRYLNNRLYCESCYKKVSDKIDHKVKDGDSDGRSDRDL